jgi:hypothetical protein
MKSRYNLVAGLDIHKKTVVVVVLQSAQPDQDYASGTFGTTQFGLKELAVFLWQYGVTHVAMESTAQYWRPVWMTLEEEFTLTLARKRVRHAPAAAASGTKPMLGALPNDCCPGI